MEHDAFGGGGGGWGRGTSGRGRGSSGGRGSVPCREYNKGTCRFGDRCRFSHQGGGGNNNGAGGGVFNRIHGADSAGGGLGGGRGTRSPGGNVVGGWGSRGGHSSRGGKGGKGHGGGQQQSGKVCDFFLKGHCTRGDQCRYMHAYSSAPDVELLAELTGHTDNVTEVMLHGSEMYSSSHDGTIRVWDSHTGQCISCVEVGGAVDAMLIESGFLFAGLKRPDGQGIVKCWNMATNSEMELAGHHGAVYCLAAGSNMLFSGGHDKTIRVYSYDAAAGAFAPSATMQAHEQAVLVMEVVEGFLFSGGAEGHIKVWDLAQGTCVQDIAAHTGHLVMELVFWEQHLLSCAMDGKVKVWASNAATAASPNFQLLQTFPPEAPGGGDVFGSRQAAAGDESPLVSICGCADSAGQPVLLASQPNGKVNLLALPSFQPRGECFLPSGQYARALAHGPGGMFFTGDSAGVVKCWRFATA